MLALPAVRADRATALRRVRRLGVRERLRHRRQIRDVRRRRLHCACVRHVHERSMVQITSAVGGAHGLQRCPALFGGLRKCFLPRVRASGGGCGGAAAAAVSRLHERRNGTQDGGVVQGRRPRRGRGSWRHACRGWLMLLMSCPPTTIPILLPTHARFPRHPELRHTSPRPFAVNPASASRRPMRRHRSSQAPRA